MLGTYFTFILILFMVLVCGAVLAYKGNLKDNIEKPLYKSISMYKDDPDPNTEAKELALKQAWNTVQTEVRACVIRLYFYDCYAVTVLWGEQCH